MKSKAEEIVYEALRIASEQLGRSTLSRIVEKAIENAPPSGRKRWSRRIGGSVYQIPVEVPEKRALALAIRWIVDGARDRGSADHGAETWHDMS